jgi:hypothetical protein
MKNRSRTGISPLLAAAVLAALSGGSAAQPAGQPAPPAKAGGLVRPGATEWPKKIPFGEMTVLLDAPQAESIEGTKLKAKGTARLVHEGETEAAAATIWYDADVRIDRERRLVTLLAVSVTRVELPGAAPAREQRLATRLSGAVTRQHVTLSLDDVLAGARFAARGAGSPPKLGTDPPKILFETEPAVLVVFDGAPRFKPVEGSFLERALNTPFLVLHDPVANAYYLDGGTAWFRAADTAGPWAKAGVVPPEALRIARRDRQEAGVAEADVEKAKASADARVPKILTTTEPAELIVSDGVPQWSPLVAGELDTMTNSESDVFRTPSDGSVWLVISGRWYRGAALAGPFTWVEPDKLPASFRRIPADSARASVLSFVPGTAPAREALRDATTPRTAAVRRADAHVNVTWDGDPKFEAVPGSQVEYALNTPESVLRIRGRYYVCDQGVWFAGDAPMGPWRVADSIPEDEIQTIPPESPVYNTRYVEVYDSTPDTVYVAYTPAYLGSYPYYGSVVFGTGWYYRPWWGAAYYPRPWTWGFHAAYARWAGWGWGFGWEPAWGGFRYGFGYGWGARWCGPGGFYRPAYRNVNVTRNVTVNRSVTVNRNLYASGANASRATTQGATASKTGGAGGAANAAKTRGTGKGAGAKSGTGPKAAAKTGKPGAGQKAHAAKAGGGGHHPKEK